MQKKIKVVKGVKLPECPYRKVQKEIIEIWHDQAFYDEEEICRHDDNDGYICRSCSAVDPRACPCFTPVEYLDDECCTACGGTLHLESETHSISYCLKCGNTFGL